MKKYFLVLLAVLCIPVSSCAKEAGNNAPNAVSSKGSAVHESAAETTTITENSKTEENTMKIKISSDKYEIVYELNDSPAAKSLYSQLPLTVETEPFSNNEITFYPPQKLTTASTPSGKGEKGALSYYAPWGDVVMYYAPASPASGLYDIGTIVSGLENVNKLSGKVTVSAY